MIKKKLVVFRRRPKEEKPEPRPTVASHTPVDQVKTPPKKRKLEKFKERRDYVMIVQYRPGLKKYSDYQKLGFKVDGDFKDAAQEANKLAIMLGKAISIDLHELRNENLCRVLAIYEVSAFHDWEKGASTPDKKEKNKFKEQNIPISYISSIKTR